MTKDVDQTDTPSYKPWDPQSRQEEVANTLVQLLGIALSIAALVILVVMASKRGDVWRIVSFSIYAISLFFLYVSSALHHGINTPRLKHFFELCDHAAIYLLIAGTYTPIALVTLRGPWGWTLFGLIWTLALLGIIIKVASARHFPKTESAIYIGMGWLIIIVLKPLLEVAPLGLFIGLLIGGLCYTLGVIFFLWRSLPFHHTIWHLFVVSGSIAHFFTILLYLA